MKQKKCLLQTATMVLLVSVMVYLLWIRPWHLRWGATSQEVTFAMPGDKIVKSPTFNATRAITIGAQTDEIWPWLVQMGCKRAGWYSYDWIDNLGIASAERILPEFQSLRVGDTTRLEQLLNQYADQPLSQIWEMIMGEVKQHGVQQDDQSWLLLRVGE